MRHREIALLFDDAGLDPLSVSRVQKALPAWIASRLEPADELTILSSSGDVFWSGTVGDDRAGPSSAIARLRGRRPTPERWRMSEWEAYQIADEHNGPIFSRVVERWSSGLCSMGGPGGNGCTSPVTQAAMDPNELRRARDRSLLAKVTRLSEALRGRGRRVAIVVFTDELLRDSSLELDFRRATETARRTNTVFYFISGRGLAGLSVFTAERDASERPDPSQIGLIAQEEAFLNTGGGEHLADETGGAFVRNTNDLSGALERVADDARDYYLLGFQPSGKVDGRWHRIEVRVNRPGLRVRSRRGYFATREPDRSGLPGELMLWSALASPRTPNGLDYSAEVLHFAPHGNRRDAVVLLDVPLLSSHEGEDDRPRHSPRLSVILSIQTDSGGTAQSLAFEYSGTTMGAGRPGGGPRAAFVKRLVALEPGRYVLASAVLDQESGRVGSVRKAFEIPAMAPDLAVGSLTLIREAEEATAASPTTDPLVLGGVSLVPALGGPPQFREGEMSFLLSVYVRPGAEPPPLTLLLVHEGKIVLRTQPSLPHADEEGQIRWIGTLSTASLSPGRYALCAAVGREPNIVEERREFELVEMARSHPSATGALKAGLDAEAPNPSPTARPTDASGVLERAGAYADDYGASVNLLVAEEEYIQWVDPPFDSGGRRVSQRRTRADIVFVKMTGIRGLPWTSFRDVYEVDGQRVRGEENRLEAAFLEDEHDSALRRAAAILTESAQYNIGSAYRTLNVPTLAMTFLRRDNQGRFRFRRKGERWFHGVVGIELEFTEIERPTMVRSIELGDIPVQGRVWIEPTRGILLRSELRFEIPRAQAEGRVTVDFMPQKGLTIWVPDRMTERYQDFANERYENTGSRSFFKGRTECTARYSDYRSFTVTTTEEVHSPGEDRK